MADKKTFKVLCGSCEKTFLVRFELVDDNAEGKGDEVVTCMHCQEKVKISIPKKYMGKSELLKSRLVDI